MGAIAPTAINDETNNFNLIPCLPPKLVRMRLEPTGKTRRGNHARLRSTSLAAILLVLPDRTPFR
jgi:hypothetical protein